MWYNRGASSELRALRSRWPLHFKQLLLPSRGRILRQVSQVQSNQVKSCMLRGEGRRGIRLEHRFNSLFLFLFLCFSFFLHHLFLFSACTSITFWSLSCSIIAIFHIVWSTIRLFVHSFLHLSSNPNHLRAYVQGTVRAIRTAQIVLKGACAYPESATNSATVTC